MADTYHPDEAPMPIEDPTGWGVYGIAAREGVAGVGLGVGMEGSASVNSNIMDQDVEIPPRYITSSPTNELEDDVGGVGATRDLDETPKPNKFSGQFEDSPSIRLGTPSAVGGLERGGPVRRVTVPHTASGSTSNTPNRRRISADENASTAALLDGISVPRPQYNPRPSATMRLKEVLAGSRPSSRSSTRSGSGVIDKPPTPTVPPMIPALVRSGSGLGTAIAIPNETDGGPDFFTSNDQLQADYETDSDGSVNSSSHSELESASTSSAEWGQSQWRGGKRRRIKNKLGLTRSSESKSSGGGSGGGWRAASRRSTGSGGGSGVAGGSGSTGPLSETEKKRMELQSRVYRARTTMPSSVPLRVFRDPAECVEAEEILRREGML